jgi:hypothetical protein
MSPIRSQPLVAILVASLCLAWTATRAGAAGSLSFARTDYLLESHLNGLDSIAVADLDGQNGPDLVVESYTAQVSPGTIDVLLNEGDGTFAPALTFDSCDGANSLVVGQFNPATDDDLDIALICGNQQEVGRMLGDGHGHFGAVQTLGVGYLTGASPAAVIEWLRVGSMDGPTLVFGGYLAGLGTTLCFLRAVDLEFDLDGGGQNLPFCNVHLDAAEQIDDWGPVANDIAVGEHVTYPGEPFPRDEAVSGAAIGLSIGVAVTSYTPFFLSTWSYGARSSGNSSTAVALANLDGDTQNDILIGGASGGSGSSQIADYVPGWPIDPGATPTHSFASIPYLYDMVTADFDGDGAVDVAALGDDDFEDDDITVAIHRGHGDGTFEAYQRFVSRGYVTTGAGEQMIAVGDFDRNGSPDLATVGQLDKWVSVLLAPEPSAALLDAAGVAALLALGRRARASCHSIE